MFLDFIFNLDKNLKINNLKHIKLKLKELKTMTGLVFS